MRFSLIWLLFCVKLSTAYDFGPPVPNDPLDQQQCTCLRVKDEIDDCSCTIEAVNQLNRLRVYPLMNEIVKQNFFHFYKVNLKRECRFWHADYLCSTGGCVVKKCRTSELPSAIREEEEELIASREKLQQSERSEAESGGSEEKCETAQPHPLGKLDETISEENHEVFKHWSSYDFASEHNFCEYDDDLSENYQYVDLLLNPERFTGYAGKSAGRIWQAIYEENCFSDHSNPNAKGSADISGRCLEERVFYRAISGLQASITVHLCYESLLPQSGLQATEKSSDGSEAPKMTDAQFGPNLCAFAARFSPLVIPDGPRRLKNLYFVYLLEFRAVAKAAPYLRRRLDTLIFTGDAEKDAETREQIRTLLKFASSFKYHFDESPLFHGDATALRRKWEIREHFRNISHIMDCVECEKCRLWGKLQIQGLGTALKILFTDASSEESDDEFGSSVSPSLHSVAQHTFDSQRLQNEVNLESQSRCTVDQQCDSSESVNLYVQPHSFSSRAYHAHSAAHSVAFQLRRNEIVALLNAFRQLSKAVHAVGEFEQMLKTVDIRETCPSLFTGVH